MGTTPVGVERTWAQDQGDNSGPRQEPVKALTWGIASVSTNTQLTLHYSLMHRSVLPAAALPSYVLTVTTVTSLSHVSRWACHARRRMYGTLCRQTGMWVGVSVTLWPLASPSHMVVFTPVARGARFTTWAD
ncbi:hypothetical protein BC827DRAFT_1228371 [Russula dissimulans]|nr:hypothetical protein BC827DRAFT_1228371 [Russula dissimulans]